MYPLIFEPDYKERVWGGQKLREVYGKKIPYEHTGESWEIACHNHGQSKILNGELAGLTLEEALLKKGQAIMGKPFKPGDKFPLLIKFIDAKTKLSVQVHPDDRYAAVKENGELGKSEAWYILQADEGAKLVAGLKDGVTKAVFKEKLEENALEEVLNEVGVKAGDVLNIPAGLIHAVGQGILLAEIQQNSDTTYRVYDWGRVGLDGKPRELHIEKSLEVIDFEHKHSKDLVQGIKEHGSGYVLTEYIRNEYFVLQEVLVQNMYQGNSENGFEIYMTLKGQGLITFGDQEVEVGLGQSFIIPKALGKYTLKAKDQEVVFVKGFIDERVSNS